MDTSRKQIASAVRFAAGAGTNKNFKEMKELMNNTIRDCIGERISDYRILNCNYFTHSENFTVAINAKVKDRHVTLHGKGRNISDCVDQIVREYDRYTEPVERIPFVSQCMKSLQSVF